MKKRYEINMTKGPLLPELLQFILPLMLSSMLQIAFNAADLIVVGRFGRPHSMAAVGANGAMINLIINVLMGLATGGGVLCARYYGANQTDKLHRTVSTTLITGVIGGVITGALGLALTVPLLRLVGSPDEVLPLATVYSSACRSWRFITFPPRRCARLATRASRSSISPSPVC